MEPVAIIDSLTTRDIVLSVSGDHLVCDAPVDVLTDEDRDLIRQYKPKLIALLTDRNNAPDSAPKATRQGTNCDDWRVRETPNFIVFESPNAPQYEWILPMKGRGLLIGHSFPTRKTQKPPEVAVVRCPRCHSNRVLPELKSTTCGLCWRCHERDEL